ncbi:hypothetical protein NFI96_023904 [Prochilodus magdalenae]|nr:hypothetical protein NFI96_023904 [Prochilodus magdalenae]
MFPIDWRTTPSKSCENIPVPIDAAHSVPWSKPNLSNKRSNLKAVESLEECVRFLKDMAKETEDIKQGRKRSLKKKDNNAQEKPVGVNQSKDLIRFWAKELNSLSVSGGVTTKGSIREETAPRMSKEESDNPIDSEMIMKWARELQSFSKNKGVTDDDLMKILTDRSMDRLKVVGLLPFLEFVVWSLLSKHSEEDISKIWLSANRRCWRADNKKYIPNSALLNDNSFHTVWQWIQTASADVRLDSNSCSPWLCVSEDKREMRECPMAQNKQESSQQFDCQSCVLGLNAFSSGRHYWEVLVPPNCCWRLGVTSASAPRKGMFSITPEAGYWTIFNGPKTLYACTEPKTKLRISLQLQVVGVYVDYEEGQVSFYDAQNRLHIYTFTQIFREALYPVFMCRDGNAVLKIHTPQRSVFAGN